MQCEHYAHAGYDVPALSASASVDAAGKLHLTLSNANPHKDIATQLFIRGLQATRVTGRVLQGATMNAHNTFDQPDAVKPQPFHDVTLTADGLTLTLPKMSVVALEVL